MLSIYSVEYGHTAVASTLKKTESFPNHTPASSHYGELHFSILITMFLEFSLMAFCLGCYGFHREEASQKLSQL